MNPLSWLYRRLPWSTEAGQIPDQSRAELEAEGVLLLAEGFRGTMTYRRYREPSEYMRYTKHSTAGSIAITGRRLLVWAQHMKYINLVLHYPLLRKVVVVAERRISYGSPSTSRGPTRTGPVSLSFGSSPTRPPGSST